MSTRFRSLAAGLILAAFALPVGVLGGDSAHGPVPSLPWLHEGLVLTYTWFAAIAPGNGSYYEEDDHGDMILHSTGQRYTRHTQTGTSGSGWMQITVVCIDGDKVVLATSNFGDAGSLGRNAPVPQGGSSAVAALRDPGDYWMDPAKLSSLRTAPADPGPPPPCGVENVLCRFRCITSTPKSPGRTLPTSAFIFAPSM